MEHPNAKEPECPACKQRAWDTYMGRKYCKCCRYRPPTSFGMGAVSIYRVNHGGERALAPEEVG